MGHPRLALFVVWLLHKPPPNLRMLIDELIQVAALQCQPLHLFDVLLPYRSVAICILLRAVPLQNDEIRPNFKGTHTRRSAPISITLHPTPRIFRIAKMGQGIPAPAIRLQWKNCRPTRPISLRCNKAQSSLKSDMGTHREEAPFDTA